MEFLDEAVAKASSFASGAAETVTSTVSSVVADPIGAASSAVNKVTADPSASLDAFAHYADEFDIVPGELGDGMKIVSSGVNKGADWIEGVARDNSHAISAATEGTALEGVGDVAAFVNEHTTGVAGGAARGLTQMGEGVAHMVDNPMQTAVGLGKLGYHAAGAQVEQAAAAVDVVSGTDPTEAGKKLQQGEHTKANMKAVNDFVDPIKKAWDDDRYGDAAGQVGVQVAALFAGAGEANAAKVGRAGELAEVSEGAQAAKGARIAEVAEGGGGVRVAESVSAEAKAAQAAKAEAAALEAKAAAEAAAEAEAVAPHAKPAPQVVPEPAPQVVPEPAPQVTPEPAPQVTPEPAPQTPLAPTSIEPAPGTKIKKLRNGLHEVKTPTTDIPMPEGRPPPPEGSQVITLFDEQGVSQGQTVVDKNGRIIEGYRETAPQNPEYAKKEYRPNTPERGPDDARGHDTPENVTRDPRAAQHPTSLSSEHNASNGSGKIRYENQLERAVEDQGGGRHYTRPEYADETSKRPVSREHRLVDENGQAVYESGPIPNDETARNYRPQPYQPRPQIVEPEATTPSPAQPAPVQPAPVQPESAQPAPVQPESAQPAPVQPSPAQPERVRFEPAQPEPAQPAPAQPTPDEIQRDLQAEREAAAADEAAAVEREQQRATHE